MTATVTPGVNLVSRDSAPSQGAPTDTSVWFVAGSSEQGPIDAAVLVRNMTEVKATFGQRVSYGTLYDALDAFFGEGGSKAYVSRIVGPTPTKGVLNLKDRSAGAGLNTLAVAPLYHGDYSTRISVTVADGVAANTFAITISLDGQPVERSGDLATPAAAAAWGATSAFVRITDLASASAAPTNNARVLAITPLSAGTDDRGNVTDATRLAALNLFLSAYGPGQVSIPGATTAVSYDNLIAHALANNRTALLDAADTPTVATISTSIVNARVDPQPEHAAMFTPPILIPGLTSGTTRTVPASAVAAGIIARRDAAGGPNVPAAGGQGIAQYAVGVTRSFIDSDRVALNAAGCDVIRVVYGQVRIYGYRTISNDPKWTSLADQRLRMKIQNEAQIIGEEFVFARLDPQGRKISEFGGALTGLLAGYYTSGALFGATPDEAFSVNVGSQVNTPATIAAQELHAVLGLKMSPFAETVFLEISKVPLSDNVG